MTTETLITCPAPLEMLRRGSPVLTRHGSGLVITPLRPRVLVYVDCLPEPIDGFGLQMDLTDATGRAHAAWWVAGRFNMNHSCVAPRLLTYYAQPWGFDWWIEDDDRSMAFGVQASLDELRDSIAEEDWSDDPLITGLVVVPALAHLDPTDDTRLPDGSRVVDALALKAVVEHLLSMEKTA